MKRARALFLLIVAAAFIGAVRFNPYRHFAPTQLGGCTLWLRADNIAGNDGDAVATWSDISGNSRNFTQGTAGSRPALKLAIANGHSVVRFATDDQLERSITLSDFFASTAMTMFIVLKQPTLGNEGVFHAESTSSTNRVTFYLVNNSPTSLLIFDDPGDDDASGRVTADVASWTSTFHVVTLQKSGTTSSMWSDGTSIVSSTVTGALNTAGTCTAYLGSDNTDHFNGDIAEVIIFNTTLSTGDRQTVERFLGGFYAITIP